MTICKNIPKTNTNYCVGDFTRLITVQIRSITPPINDSTDHGEDFVEFVQMYAVITTTGGISVFDETNTVVGVSTHEFVVPFRPNITFENWINYNGKRFRILDVNTIDIENRWIVLRATERGTDTLPVNTA